MSSDDDTSPTPMTVDELIRALRDRKRQDPRFGSYEVYAGDCHYLPVADITVINPPRSRPLVLLADGR